METARPTQRPAAPPSETVLLRWKCPECGRRVGFLPPDLGLPCPGCGKAAARDFLENRHGWPAEAERPADGAYRCACGWHGPRLSYRRSSNPRYAGLLLGACPRCGVHFEGTFVTEDEHARLRAEDDAPSAPEAP